MTKTIIELTVKNHPGVLYRISGIFARKGFNLDGVIASGLNGGEKSKLLLFVENNEIVSKIVKQLEKSFDVIDIVCSNDLEYAELYPQAV